MSTKWTIATRSSPLALAQTQLVLDALKSMYPDISLHVLPLHTQGDRSCTEGKDLFTQEIREAVLDGRAHYAVHSVKDLGSVPHQQLSLAAVLKRGNPRDVWISREQMPWTMVPKNAVVGTSSPRRCAQINLARPDIQCLPLRGNIHTRLAQLKTGAYDGIVLAAAGLHRLGLQAHITEYFETEYMIPAIGQGAIGIECLSTNVKAHHLIRKLNHKITNQCIAAERMVSAQCGGNCWVPIAAYARTKRNHMILNAFLASHTGHRMVRVCGTRHEPEALGMRAAEVLRTLL